MRKMIQRLFNFREESGASLVIVALAMVTLLGFTAIAIDGGRLYTEKSKLQKAMDAAVLAGAQGLMVDTTHAESIAIDISTKNGFALVDPEIESVEKDYIKATKEIKVPLTFARVLGMEQATVSASAKAKIAPLKSSGGIAPIAVEQSQIPNGTELNCGNPGNNHGNCGFLDLNGSGANGLADGIMNGGIFSVGTEVVETEPGEKWGPVRDAINYLIESDADKPHCQSPDTADNQCKRVIYVVVIDTWENADGKSTLNVVGLAAYWIEGIDGQRIKGQFLRMVTEGDLGAITGIGDYNLYGVELVE